MRKITLIILIIFSIVLTYGIAIVEAIVSGSIIGGSAGLPLDFASGFFGEANTNYIALLTDIIFWFIVILIIWKLLLRSPKKKIK